MDITKCRSTNCPIKDKCYRYLADESEHFKVEGYYEEGVETNNGAIADYWLKSITTITHQEQQP